MNNGIFETVRKLTAQDSLGDLDEKYWNTFTDVGKVIRPRVSRPAPAVVLRASYDVHSPWRAATRTA